MTAPTEAGRTHAERATSTARGSQGAEEGGRSERGQQLDVPPVGEGTESALAASAALK